MNVLLFITTILTGFITTDEPKVEVVRSLFYEAAANKSAAARFSKALSVVDNNSSPVLVCYKGVSEMLLAKHVISPFSKMDKFRKGKNLIERSIRRDPNDLELRFLRFSIQSNLPGFLGYDQAIAVDKVKLLEGYSTIKNTELRNRIFSYLSSSKYCTVNELKKIAK